MQPKNRTTSICLLLMLLFVVGCVPSPEIRSGFGGSRSDPRTEQAEDLAATGDYVAAAQLFEQMATGKESPEKDRLLLRAAEYRFLAADPDSAAGLLAQIRVADQPQLDFQRRLLVAEMAIARNRPDEALELLAAPPPATVPAELRRRYHKDRAEGFRLAGNLFESGRELGELDLLTEDHGDRLDNQLAIIQTYAGLTDNALDLLQPIPPGIQGGWMELTRIIKAHSGDEQQIKPLFAQWRQKFPSHPALPELLDGYFKKLKGQYRRVEQLAVVLPESGPYAGVAASLKEGMLAAYYQEDSGQHPQLMFYDSSNPEEIWPIYQQAVEAGADMVIGPLEKQAVGQLTRAGELQIPVLALNQVPSEQIPPADLYQFSLSPEDEARQVAERAWTDGFSTALVLTPVGEWGTRLYEAFRRRWEELGGKLAEHQEYDPGENDFTQPIQALLNLDESNDRKKELQGLLGKRLEFEPRRRQDAGFVFLAAKPQLARQIRPQLQFHHAADLPVYTTSHVYAGLVSPDADLDLEGIRFPVMPWLVSPEMDDPLSLQQLLTTLPDAQPGYFPLYAMGMDSIHLLPHLARLQSSPREILEGKTGNLYLDRINQLHRQMVWAEFVKGVPQVTGFAPRLDSGYGEFPESPVDQRGILPDPLQQSPLPESSPNLESEG